MLLIQSMIETKYPTSLEKDLKILDSLYRDEGEIEDEEVKELIDGVKNKWHYKLALIHRVN